MAVIKPGFCSKLTDEFDNRMKMLKGLERKFDAKLRELDAVISTASWSPHWAINKFKRDLAKNINSLVPSLTEFDELVDLANACLFTKGDPMLSKPSTLVNAVKGNVLNNAFATMNNLAKLADAVIPEFSASKLVSELKTQLGVGGVTKTLPEATQLLNCMSAICGTNINSRYNQLNTFITKYSLNGKGEINVEGLLASQGISTPLIQKQVKRCFEQVDGIVTKVETSFTAGRERLKRLVPDDDSLE